MSGSSARPAAAFAALAAVAGAAEASGSLAVLTAAAPGAPCAMLEAPWTVAQQPLPAPSARQQGENDGGAALRTLVLLLQQAIPELDPRHPNHPVQPGMFLEAALGSTGAAEYWCALAAQISPAPAPAPAAACGVRWGAAGQHARRPPLPPPSPPPRQLAQELLQHLGPSDKPLAAGGVGQEQPLPGGMSESSGAWLQRTSPPASGSAGGEHPTVPAAVPALRGAHTAQRSSSWASQPVPSSAPREQLPSPRGVSTAWARSVGGQREHAQHRAQAQQQGQVLWHREQDRAGAAEQLQRATERAEWVDAGAPPQLQLQQPAAWEEPQRTAGTAQTREEQRATPDRERSPEGEDTDSLHSTDAAHAIQELTRPMEEYEGARHAQEQPPAYAPPSAQRRRRPDQQKQRVPWSREEAAALVAGVRLAGVGRWAEIKRLPSLGAVLANRSVIDLKDKWRNLARIAHQSKVQIKRRLDSVGSQTPLELVLEVKELLAKARSKD